MSRDLCDYRMLRGWWCKRDRGHRGPCSLVPKWWNIADRVRFR